MMVRMQKDVGDCRRRERKYVNEERIDDNEWSSARLLHLKKAYPSVKKFYLWRLLEQCELKGRCLETHEFA